MRNYWPKLYKIKIHNNIIIVMEKDSKKIARCFICGCTEHKFIGCINHWKNHEKKIGQRCHEK